MARFWTGRALVGAAVVLAAGLVVGLGWYLAGPLLFNQRVDEAFPAAAPAAMQSPDAMAAPAAMADHPTAVPAAMADHPTAVPAAMSDHSTAVPAAMSDHPTAAATPAAMADHPTAAATPTPAGPLLLREGVFGNMDDNLHKGQGRAAVYHLADGTRLLRLEDFNVTNGPDLYVYLSASANPRTARDFSAAPSVNLARLKGNVGNQNYSLPADLDLADFQSVVIYCKKYNVIISTAALSTLKG